MAAETGGLYYQANTSQNLATIYQQLASLLYGNQYVVEIRSIAENRCWRSQQTCYSA